MSSNIRQSSPFLTFRLSTSQILTMPFLVLMLLSYEHEVSVHTMSFAMTSLNWWELTR
jgi:hypothetical protein